MRLFYLGPQGTHSHEAAVNLAARFASHNVELVSERTIESAIHRVEESPAHDAVGACVPLENSIQGSVTMTWDTLGRLARVNPPEQECQVYLAAQWKVPIEHHLLTYTDVPLQKIRKVVSHPQALGQCQTWLRGQLPQAEQVQVASTAEGARYIASLKDPSVAAIGTKIAGAQFHLHCSEGPIQDSDENQTRFGLLVNHHPFWVELIQSTSRSQHVASAALLLTGVINQPGGLMEALKPFHDVGLSITRIESRPVGKRLGEYVFYLDVELTHHVTNESDDRWRRVISSLRNQSIQVYRLGWLYDL